MSTSRLGPDVTILVVDDDEIEQLALARAFRRAELDASIETACDGEEALARLRGGDGRKPIPRPNLILLDLRMPRMDGLELLGELRGDPELSDLVVFMLTTSDLESDKRAAYAHHVAGYIRKPDAGSDGFEGLVELLGRYTDVVQLPR